MDAVEQELQQALHRIGIMERYIQKLEGRYADVFRENLNHSLNIDLLNDQIGQQSARLQRMEEIVNLASDRVKMLEEELSKHVPPTDTADKGEHHGADTNTNTDNTKPG